MRAILEFDLATTEGREDHTIAIQAHDMKEALETFSQILRRLEKYGGYGDDGDRIEATDGMVSVALLRDKFNSIVSEYLY